MDLTVNSLRGETKNGNSYYDDHFGSFGAFDYVLVNPCFNEDDVSLSSVEQDQRFNTYGIPRNKSRAKKADAGKKTVPNGNNLWINLFADSLRVARSSQHWALGRKPVGIQPADDYQL